MNDQTFDGFLLGITWVCFIGAGLNLFLVQKRGWRAVAMAMAFLAFGLAASLYRKQAPAWATVSFGTCAVIALGADVLLRFKQPGAKR